MISTTNTEKVSSPLDGLRVLDLTRLLPGAACTQTLADAGAEVIKIEQPPLGDYARHMEPKINGTGALFTEVNRGKKSIFLDLKTTEGRDALLEMAATADVLAEGFRPGVMDRLGLGYETLRDRNPRLIYLSLTGYNPDGPDRDRAGHDINYLAMSGLLDLTGPKDGPPSIPGVQLADLAGGAQQAVIGILLALVARQRTGHGQWVEVNMRDGLEVLMAVPRSLLRATGQAPKRGDGWLTGRDACYNVYQAKDGRWLALGALELKFWETLCRALNRPDLIPRHRDNDQESLKSELQAIFLTATAEDWFTRLGPLDACLTPVLPFEQAEERDPGPHLDQTPLIRRLP